MPEPTDQMLVTWISPATMSMEPKEIARYQKVINQASTKPAPTRALELVELAHRVGTPTAKEWLATAVRKEFAAFVAVGNDELLARIACCVAVRVMNSNGETASLVGLAAQSAEFVGLESPVVELGHYAATAVAEGAANERARPRPWKPVAPAIEKSFEDDTPEPEAVDAQTRLEEATIQLARAIDQLGQSMDRATTMIGEEYDTLWWSYSGRSLTQAVTWDEVEPTSRRVVIAAHELSERISQVPGPPLVPGLLGIALGSHAADEVELSEIILAASENSVAVAPDANHRLLPISSGVRRIAELGADGDTWREALTKTLGLDLDRKTSAVDAAAQLFRERDIGKLVE